MKKRLLTVLLAFSMVATSGAVAFADDMMNVGTLYITRGDEGTAAGSTDNAVSSTAAGAEQGVSAAAAGEGLLIATRDNAVSTSAATEQQDVNAVSAAADAEQQDVNSVSSAVASIRSVRPTLTKVKSVRYDRLKLTWEKVSGADGYKVYRATKKNGKYKVVGTVKGADSLTYTDTKRTCGKTYYYKIRAYEVKDGKNVYSKYSDIRSGKSVPSKSAVTGAWDENCGTGTIVEWKGVSGATDYQIQYRYTEAGKTTKWRSTIGPDIEGNTYKFYTYNASMKACKKRYPSGYVTGVVLAGYPEDAKISVKEYVETSVKKNQARISELTQSKFAVLWNDDIREEIEAFLEAGGTLDERYGYYGEKTIELRVRAYRTVNGKKVYGAWSEPYTMVETFDIDKAYEELRAYAIEYAKENYPEWKYDDYLAENVDDTRGSYYVEGDFMANAGKYVKTEDFIEYGKDSIEYYISNCVEKGGHLNGCLYIKKVCPGDTEGMKGATRNESDDTYYKMWMFWGN